MVANKFTKGTRVKVNHNLDDDMPQSLVGMYGTVIKGSRVGAVSVKFSNRKYTVPLFKDELEVVKK